MKKGCKKVFSIVLISLMFLSLITGIAAANDDNTVFDPIKDMFASWQEGNLSVNIAKYLFVILLTLLIFAIVKTIPFLKNTDAYITFPISLIIAFLSTAYLTPEEIYLMLVSYTTMGLVMGAIIPFVIMLFFSIEIAKESKAGGRIFVKIMWVVFIIFLFYKIIAGWASGQLEAGGALIYLIVIVTAILYITILQTALLKMWFKEELESAQDRLKRKLELQQKKRELEAESAKQE